MSDPNVYSNEEFRTKYQAGALDLVPQECWLLSIEDGHYVVSFEPTNCTGATSVPFSMVDKVKDLFTAPCQGDNGVLRYCHRILLYLKKPQSAEGGVLFQILLIREREEQAARSSGGCGCRGESSPQLGTNWYFKCYGPGGVDIYGPYPTPHDCGYVRNRTYCPNGTSECYEPHRPR
jgi:hypothetical protein